MSAEANRIHAYRKVDGALLLSSDITIPYHFKSKAVETARRIACVQVSPCGAYIASGDMMGCVTIRESSRIGAQLLSLNAGTGRIAALAWHHSLPNTLFVASANGHLNSVQFDDNLENPRNVAAVKVSGLITSLKVNRTGTRLAVSFGYNVLIFSLPLRNLEAIDRITPPRAETSGFRLNIAPLDLENWRKIPVRDHPRPLGIEYIGEEELCVAFFGRFEVYNTTCLGEEMPLLYSIPVPNDTAVGSFAISPNGEHIVATNTKTGIDWYSTRLKRRISTTAVKDNYSKKSFIMPVAFLTDTTVVCGHHQGCLIVAQHGHDQSSVFGKPEGTLAQYVSVTVTANIMVVAVGVGKDLVVHPLPLTPPGEASEANPPSSTSGKARAPVSNTESQPPTTPETDFESFYAPETPTPASRRNAGRARAALGLKEGSPSEQRTTPASSPDRTPPRTAWPSPRQGFRSLPPALLGHRHFPEIPVETSGPVRTDQLGPGLAVSWIETARKTFLAVWDWNPKAAVALVGLAILIIVSTTRRTLQWGQYALSSRAPGFYADGGAPVSAYVPAPDLVQEDIVGLGAYSGDSEDYLGEGDAEDDLDDGHDELVVTETKLVTVTKTITKSFTSTVTVTVAVSPSASATRVTEKKAKRHAKKGRRLGKGV